MFSGAHVVGNYISWYESSGKLPYGTSGETALESIRLTVKGAFETAQIMDPETDTAAKNTVNYLRNLPEKYRTYLPKELNAPG